jgi:Pregnancy-associated plasma protein-A/Secretion system C-terminal sorting domain
MIMKKKILLSIFILGFALNRLSAQEKTILPQKTCGSTFNLEEIKRTDPARYARFLKLEEHTEQYKKALQELQPNRLINSGSVIIIPVVVHVIHNGESVGTGRNISDAQITSQIVVLNEDFRRLNADASNTPAAFSGVAADPNFEFRLACVDPSGSSTSGITRTQSSTTSFTDDNAIKFTSSGGLDAWATNKYLNIWVSYLSGGLGGYAQFPWDYATYPNTDGVVVEARAFGTTGNLFTGYDLGRVTTHEIGHWLNVYHIWGDDGTSCSGSDLCGDTPNQAGSNFNCPSYPHTDACSGSSPGVMFMNYMDYTLDACKNLFTADQATRMRAVFASGGVREPFIENYFHVNELLTPICSSGTVSVTNLSCLSVTWSVVSGPATITSGQGTNTVTLSATGNGIAVVQATAGGYVDEKNIMIGVQTPSNIINLDYPTPIDGGTTLTLYANDGNIPTYSWTVVGGTITTNNGYSIVVNVDNCDPNILYNSYINVYLTYTNACGTGNEYGEWTYVICNNGGGPLKPVRFSIDVYPNPSKEGSINLSIEGGSKSSNQKSPDRIQIKLYDLVTKNMVRQWSFAGDLKNYKLNTFGIRKGHYIIEVVKGTDKQTKHIVID